MARTVREIGRWEWARALKARLGAALWWVFVLVAGAVSIGAIDKWVDPQRLMPGLLGDLIEPTKGLQTIVEVVPSIVIAIFVFAVGTLSRRRSSRPHARGTRAVEILRNRHLAWTISPALALTPLTIIVLVVEPAHAWPLAVALLLGAVAYLLISTGFLLGILGEATNPVLFAAVLANLVDEAVASLQPASQEARGSRNSQLGSLVLAAQVADRTTQAERSAGGRQRVI